MVTKRRHPALAVGLALTALSGCVPAEKTTAADFQCPTVWQDPLGVVVYENSSYSVKDSLESGPIPYPYSTYLQDHDYWLKIIEHGSNAQLAAHIKDGTSRLYRNVSQSGIRDAKQAQLSRHLADCRDVANLPLFVVAYLFERT